MRFIIALGNPGDQYAQTRHNAGVFLVDKLAIKLPSNYGWRKYKEKMVFESPNLTLVKTASVFMNESGRLVTQYKDREIWIVHDDLDIRIGEYKVQRGIGPKVHNGLLSVEQALGTKDFWRIRIGIENRGKGTEEQRFSGEDYVLQRFNEEEQKIIDNVLNEIIQTIFK